MKLPYMWFAILTMVWGTFCGSAAAQIDVRCVDLINPTTNPTNCLPQLSANETIELTFTNQSVNVLPAGTIVNVSAAPYSTKSR